MSIQEIIRIFAGNLYKYRMEAGLTQKELADMLGCDNSYISMLERGVRVPSLITIHSAAQSVGVKPVDLITEDPVAGNWDFKQKELLYIIKEGRPKEIDKVYRIFKICK